MYKMSSVLEILGQIFFFYECFFHLSGLANTQEPSILDYREPKKGSKA